ncbi:hypothetical protein [Spirosoma pulveris]
MGFSPFSIGSTANLPASPLSIAHSYSILSQLTALLVAHRGVISVYQQESMVVKS